jgi:hypothetical protein
VGDFVPHPTKEEAGDREAEEGPVRMRCLQHWLDVISR